MATPKNFRKIPNRVRYSLRSLPDKIVVGCARHYNTEDLRAGRLAHLGVTWDPRDGLSLPREGVVPPPQVGRTSEVNVNGREIVRKDLPKQTCYNYVETPNWGDSYNGTHTVALPYERYPRDFEPPQLLRIRIQSLRDSNSNHNGQVLLSFEVADTLDKRTRAFGNLLLFRLNLLQENVGDSGVKPAGATADDYLRDVSVDWEILPPGTKEEAVARLYRGRQATDAERREAGDRYDFLMSLRPRGLVYGSTGFHRYFGALLHDDLVVFENIEYGNAVYVMFRDWERLSRMSRLELLSGRVGEQFERVIHRRGWKRQVRAIVAAHRS